MLTERKRRQLLAELLSDHSLASLVTEAKQAREALLGRVSGSDERPVIDLTITIETLMIALQEFSDSRTEQ